MAKVYNFAEFSVRRAFIYLMFIIFCGSFNIRVYLLVHLSIILALFILLVTSNCTLENLSHLPMM